MSPYDRFQKEAQRIRDLQGLHASLQASVTSAIDFSDLLRSVIVLIVSALDFYIHAVVKEKMVEAFSGVRPRTNALMNFNVKIESVIDAMNSPVKFDWLHEEIRKQHGWKSFQQPDKIRDVLKLVTDKNIWEEISIPLATKPADLKNTLELLVDRRNKIAHEADADPSLPTHKLPINTSITSNAIQFVEDIVREIDLIL